MKHRLLTAFVLMVSMSLLGNELVKAQEKSIRVDDAITPCFTFTADGSVKKMNFTVRTANESQEVRVVYPDGKEEK